MIHIKINTDLAENVPSALLKKAALTTLENQAVPKPHHMTIVLADDSQLQTLNRDYLGIDAPTDVLSFPTDEIEPETGKKYLGDIIISIPRAAQQAKAAGHSFDAEAQLLVVHGVLHLLGYDHATIEEKARMWQVQGEVLANLGLGRIQVREE
jgi:probable rRNA maturation factor